MPYEGLGRRHETAATKVTVHGAPAIEDGFPGIADKVTQLDRFVNPQTAAATQIAIGDPIIIQLGGIHEVAGALIPGGIAAAPRGTPLYIRAADNAIVLAAGAGISKFGRVTEVIASRSLVRVNADARDTF